MDGTATVVSVNVGQPRTLPWNGSTVTTSIWKAPVSGRVEVRGVNVDGDDQSDRSVHGGPDKAVYSYALSDYQWWSAELGQDVVPGNFGDNLTIDGLDVSDALIGERWQIGSCVFEVSQPRIPCFKLGIRMGDPQFPRRFAAAERPGAYLRIIAPGALAAGDTVTVLSRPSHGLTSRLVSRAYHADRSLVPLMLTVPELSASWRDWALKMSRDR